MDKKTTNPKNAGRKPIGDKPMTAAERKKLERQQKKDFGLIFKSVWILPEDEKAIDELNKKALKKYKNN